MAAVLKLPAQLPGSCGECWEENGDSGHHGRVPLCSEHSRWFLCRLSLKAAAVRDQCWAVGHLSFQTKQMLLRGALPISLTLEQMPSMTVVSQNSTGAAHTCVTVDQEESWKLDVTSLICANLHKDCLGGNIQGQSFGMSLGPSLARHTWRTNYVWDPCPRLQVIWSTLY